jgi:hypothetical protein
MDKYVDIAPPASIAAEQVIENHERRVPLLGDKSLMNAAITRFV